MESYCGFSVSSSTLVSLADSLHQLQHDGKQPIWSGKLSQKKEFIASITKTRRHGDEENYAEAEEKAFLAAQVTKVSFQITLRSLENIELDDLCLRSDGSDP